MQPSSLRLSPANVTGSRSLCHSKLCCTLQLSSAGQQLQRMHHTTSSTGARRQDGAVRGVVDAHPVQGQHHGVHYLVPRARVALRRVAHVRPDAQGAAFVSAAHCAKISSAKRTAPLVDAWNAVRSPTLGAGRAVSCLLQKRVARFSLPLHQTRLSRELLVRCSRALMQPVPCTSRDFSVASCTIEATGQISTLCAPSTGPGRDHVPGVSGRGRHPGPIARHGHPQRLHQRKGRHHRRYRHHQGTSRQESGRSSSIARACRDFACTAAPGFDACPPKQSGCSLTGAAATDGCDPLVEHGLAHDSFPNLNVHHELQGPKIYLESLTFSAVTAFSTAITTFFSLIRC